MLCGLDLFSGIGGISLALSPWVEPIAYCENDRYAQAVLLLRMSTGELPTAPIWDDITTLPAGELPAIDIIYGGFPCQDISVAGHAAGLEGQRSGLFFEVVRLASDIRPRFIFLENVPAITTRGLGTVVGEMVRLGYDCRWTILSAQEVGANHQRKRWFLLAHANYIGRDGRAGVFGPTGRRQSEDSSCEDASKGSWWATEPDVGRVVDGLPQRMDRVKCLGNAVVPLQAREAFKELMGIIESVDTHIHPR